MKTFVYIGIIGASALLLASCKGKSKPMENARALHKRIHADREGHYLDERIPRIP